MADAAAAATSAATSAASSMEPISAGIQAATAIAMTVASINDMNKRRQFEQNLAMLTADQRAELEKRMLAANTQTARLQIMINALTEYKKANLATEARARNIKLVMFASAGVAVLGLVIWSFKK